MTTFSIYISYESSTEARYKIYKTSPVTSALITATFSTKISLFWWNHCHQCICSHSQKNVCNITALERKNNNLRAQQQSGTFSIYCNWEIAMTSIVAAGTENKNLNVIYGLGSFICLSEKASEVSEKEFPAVYYPYSKIKAAPSLPIWS